MCIRVSGVVAVLYLMFEPCFLRERVNLHFLGGVVFGTGVNRVNSRLLIMSPTYGESLLLKLISFNI